MHSTATALGEKAATHRTPSQVQQGGHEVVIVAPPSGGHAEVVQAGGQLIRGLILMPRVPPSRTHRLGLLAGLR